MLRRFCNFLSVNFLLGALCFLPSVADADLAFYDNFADGTLSGWTYDGGAKAYLGNPNPNTVLPDIVPSPAGYAIAGPSDPTIGGWMTRSVAISNFSTLNVSMQAKSDFGWPNHVAF